MKSIIAKWKNTISFWSFYSEIAGQDHGANKRYTPRILRRLFAGTRHHRAWVWGRLNPSDKPKTYLQAKAVFWKKRWADRLFGLAVRYRAVWLMFASAHEFVFERGFIGNGVPRFVRRLLAGTSLHRSWVRGRITHSVDFKGRCAAFDGHMHRFKPQHFRF